MKPIAKLKTFFKEKNPSTFIKCGCGILSLFLVGIAVYQLVVPTISISTNSTNHKHPIYRVENSQRQIALSFDVTWGNKDTDILLEILDKHQIKATFFLTGEWIEKYPDDVKKIADAGHDLGNHSENHKNMSQLSASQCQDELMSTHHKIKELTGIEMNLFRAPYGDYNNNLIETASNCGYHTIQWDIDSLDWKDYGSQNIINTVTTHKNLDNGSIILMHLGTKYTNDSLDELISILKDSGYQFVPISELILTKDFKSESNTDK